MDFVDIGPRVEEYVCDSCGYRIVRAQPPSQCPMCQGRGWQAERASRDLTVGRVSGATVAEATFTSLAKRSANRMIHEIVSPNSGTGLVGFFCECADPNCHTVLWLTADAFERASADPAWHALAPGHEASVSESLEPA